MSVKPLTKGSSSIHLRFTFRPPSVHLPSTSGIGLAPIRPRSLSISVGQSCLVHFPSQRSTTIAPCPCQRPRSGCGANTQSAFSLADPRSTLPLRHGGSSTWISRDLRCVLPFELPPCFGWYVAASVCVLAAPLTPLFAYPDTASSGDLCVYAHDGPVSARGDERGDHHGGDHDEPDAPGGVPAAPARDDGRGDHPGGDHDELGAPGGVPAAPARDDGRGDHPGGDHDEPGAPGGVPAAPARDDGRGDHHGGDHDELGPLGGVPAPSPNDRSSTPFSHLRPGGRSNWIHNSLPSANITRLPLDGVTLRASMSAIQTALEREDAFQQLQQSYQVLQDRFDVANRRITELEADFAHTAQLAAPYVQLCQNRYENARHDLQAAQRQYQEVVEALADHEGDAARILSLERQIARDEQQHATAIATRDRLIGDLQRQLTAALLQPPALASSQQELQRQLDVETACHARVNVELVRVENDRDQLQDRVDREIADHLQTQADLQRARDSIALLETSQKALEEGSSRLRRQVERLEQRLKETQDEADLDLSLAVFERDQARTQLDQANRQLSDRATTLRDAMAERDAARASQRAQGESSICLTWRGSLLTLSILA
jgi:hypothetical protein